MNTLILGDIHGDFKPIRGLYQNHSYELDETNNTLILLGDAGLNFFFDYRDDNFKKKLGKYPFTYFVVRGNHEERPSVCKEKNPDKWHTEIYWRNTVYVENQYPYIKYALDFPEVYWINTGYGKYKTLVVPGAYSIDKYHRLATGGQWFPQEQLTIQEMNWGLDIVKADPRFDLILSHTCPSIYEPTHLYLSVVDQSTVDKTMERYLMELESKLDYKAWCWGHYHQFLDYPRTDDRYHTMLSNDIALQLDMYMKGELEKWSCIENK